MIRDFAVQSEPTTAIGQIEVNLFAKAALGPNAHAVADDQHADHQRRIDRGSAHLAVKRLQRLAQISKVQVTVDAPEQVVGGDMLVEAEIIKQPRRRLLKPHHSRSSCRISRNH